jgi:4'-phosphopantetheinyl transferase
MARRPLELYWARLDAPAPRDAVTPAERERAARFRHPADRDRFLAARAWRRQLLAAELDCAPQDVPIVAEPGGKPRVEGSELCFSASRSAGSALFAVSWTGDVGVDVEAQRSDVDIEGIARRFFTASERRALEALPATARTAAAFGGWTRKEAYAKATGTGLTFTLADVEVGIGGAGPVTVAGWTIVDVDLGPGLPAAVAGAWPPGWTPPAPRLLGDGHGCKAALLS